MNSSTTYNQMAFSDKAKIINDYCYLVKRIAHHLKGRLPHNIMLDDLIQAGMMGLLEASKNYDEAKGASFETYAGIRIRGAMLDEIRKNDWVPRSVHRNARKIAKAIQDIENRTGKVAKDPEIAKELDISIEEYRQMLQSVKGAKIFAFEDIGMQEDSLTENVVGRVSEPSDGLQRQHFQVALVKNIKTLPERERLVLSLYYDEDLNLREIGDIMGVSESRVCQIHSTAMIRLKSRMQDWTQ